MSEQHDNEIISQCLEGSHEAFELLVDRYQKIVFNVALRMVSNFEDAGDITQNVFIKAYEKMHTYNGKYKFFSWLYRMTINESINWLKRKKTLSSVNLDEGIDIKTPEDNYIDRELNERVQSAICLLPLHYRTVVIFKHLEDLSYREIGYILGIPEKRVKSRLFTARQMLSDIFQREGILSYD